MSEFIAMIQRIGFDSYKDLIRWTRNQLNTRTIKNRTEAVYRSEVIHLYVHHFDLDKEEAIRLYHALLGMGLLKEHFGWLSESYLCTTFNV